MEGFDYLIYKNDSSDITLKNTIDFRNSVNVELTSPNKGVKISITVKPGEQLVIPIIEKVTKQDIQKGYFQYYLSF